MAAGGITLSPALVGAGKTRTNQTAHEIKTNPINALARLGRGFQLLRCRSRTWPELSANERAEVKKVARDLLARLKQLLVLNWRQKSTPRSQLQLAIEDVLDTDLPRAYDKPLYEQKCSAVFEHNLEGYPERDAGMYAAAV